jgi:hypothetical protein
VNNRRAAGAPQGNQNAAKERETIFDTIKDDVKDCPELAPTGNSVKAALRRLRKDRSDLHEQVLAGELTAGRQIFLADKKDLRPCLGIDRADLPDDSC